MRERDVVAAQAACDLDVHENVLFQWVRECRRPRDPVFRRTITGATLFFPRSAAFKRRDCRKASVIIVMRACASDAPL